MFYHFDKLGSTIDEARDRRYVHGDVIVADEQTAGRGQRGRQWSSPKGENLLLSVVLDSSFLRADEQFLLLQAVAVALVETMASYGLEARIKWTNDIYIGDRKITGVLIDHTLGPGGMLERSGAGIGINVGQRVFEPWLPNPTSMALEAGRSFDRGEVLERFHTRLMSRFEALRRGERAALQQDYHARIYRLDTPATFELPDGSRFTGTIRGVEPTGELCIETAGPTPVIEKFLYREVSFVI